MTLTDASHIRNTGPLEQQTITETLLQDERAPASALPTITMAEGRTHLDLSLDAAVMIDALGRIVLVNEQATTLFGYDQDEVQDGGIGIPLHQQARIFGRFMRADNARAAGISGTGLGLYLCRALVEQHAGRFWFESGEGEGTTFFVTIPLHL
jgi:PAS domain-containing protein